MDTMEEEQVATTTDHVGLEYWPYRGRLFFQEPQERQGYGKPSKLVAWVLPEDVADIKNAVANYVFPSRLSDLDNGARTSLRCTQVGEVHALNDILNFHPRGPYSAEHSPSSIFGESKYEG